MEGSKTGSRGRAKNKFTDKLYFRIKNRISYLLTRETVITERHAEKNESVGQSVDKS